jgi:catechol 2,3-dioxygenase-like lactoylglutathione lyase family enzyme
MITGTSFTVFSSDLVQSRRFYETRLGCELSDVDDDGFVARRDRLVITVEGGAVRRKLGKRWLGEGGLYITILVDDFDAVMEDLRSREAPFLDDVTEGADGKRVTGIADPDGVLFELREA